jgi:hypothetical protein
MRRARSNSEGHLEIDGFGTRWIFVDVYGSRDGPCNWQYVAECGSPHDPHPNHLFSYDFGWPGRATESSRLSNYMVLGTRPYMAIESVAAALDVNAKK